MGSIVSNIMKLAFVACVFVTLGNAQYPAENPEEVPRPYNYQFGVKDEYTKSNFAKTESQDDRGNVKGSFVIALPDGRIQTTTYTADPIQGFIAEVTYSGEAVFPPAPVGGYPGEGENKYVAPAVPRYAN